VVESPALERALEAVRARISAACERAGRDPGEVRLIGATKKVPADVMRRAFEAGITEFGENYVQELEGKRRSVPSATWHFVGRLQRNKVPRVLGLADVVHTLEPGPAADRMTELVEDPATGPACLVEVDYAGGRVGVAPEEAERFVAELAARNRLRLTGLTTVPPLGEPARPYFRRLRELRDRLRDRVPTLVDLSMGMSADYEEAVEEGATMVRVGTAIFGPRR
jgi:PLP dependent protein